nr:unnamed protein product [Digitaria exilis]
MPPLPSRDGSDTLHRAEIATSRYGATVVRAPLSTHALHLRPNCRGGGAARAHRRPAMAITAATCSHHRHRSSPPCIRMERERRWGDEPTRGAARPARSRGERGREEDDDHEIEHKSTKSPTKSPQIHEISNQINHKSEREEEEDDDELSWPLLATATDKDKAAGRAVAGPSREGEDGEQRRRRREREGQRERERRGWERARSREGGPPEEGASPPPQLRPGAALRRRQQAAADGRSCDFRQLLEHQDLMAGAVIIDDSAASSTGSGNEDHGVSCDSLSGRRSYGQVDNGVPSTSPPFWDIDDDDDDPGMMLRCGAGEIVLESVTIVQYILVYPQGCDVSNHLSLFLCVADHDKFLPGWGHFAQFTIAVGNLDPKKVKYSDTLHRFWKKEHDWGWKKFMELSKIHDGFLVDDVLEIIAQVQVIRRKYIRLIDDDMKWPSFRAFWSSMDPTTKHRMSREKSEIILKTAVKHFFLEKEVTSTLVMDALYTGLKALEGHSNGKKGTVTSMNLEELPAPMVHLDMDMFVLAGDFIALVKRAASESFGIDVAYKEAVALKRQEELIREEELLENEKGKRGSAIEKDKRAKKKQAKQKKNSRKVKDKEREEKSNSNFLEKGRDGSTTYEWEHEGLLHAKLENSGDCASDVSDNIDGSTETCEKETVDIESLVTSVSATKEIEGRELLKAHLEKKEKKAAAEAATGSSSASSSDSLEKTTQVRKGPEKSSVTINDGNVNAPPPKSLPVATNGDNNGAVPTTATSTINTKSVPIVTPTPDPILCEEHVSSSSQQIDTLVPSRSPLVDKAISTPPESPLPLIDTVGKATPAPPKSLLPQVNTDDKATTPATTETSASQLDKVAKAISAAPKKEWPSTK